MEVILLGIYGFFVWLIFFKFKWLPWNFTSQFITITLPIVGMMVLFLLLNIAAPATDDVRAMNYDRDHVVDRAHVISCRRGDVQKEEKNHHSHDGQRDDNEQAGKIQTQPLEIGRAEHTSN